MESPTNNLPPSISPTLHLAHPTPSELQKIYHSTFPEWGNALTLPSYLQESDFLASAALKPTLWILVDKSLSPDSRLILSSCETFRKKCLTGSKGTMREGIVYGIASVFCESGYRGRGYASRMLKELGKMLRDLEGGDGVGSVLYSDIGRAYYSRLGWYAVPNNCHLEFPASKVVKKSGAKPLFSGDLAQLCQEDERLIQESRAIRTTEKKWFMIVPDEKHMLWHHMKEEFVSENLFGKVPQVKGAISGSSGNRIWIIWTHGFYEDPKLKTDENILYILRLVVENTEGGEENKTLQTEQTREVIWAAQEEAREWDLARVVLWDPTAFARDVIVKGGIECQAVQRETKSIGSLMWWYGEESAEEVDWIANEKYAWC